MFITPCGINGVLEAIHNNVPIVGMPLWLDQFDVAARVVEKEIGLVIENFADSDGIYSTIVEVQDNKK